MQFFSILGAVIFGIIVVLTVLVTLGLPLGEFTMGGKYKVIPPKMRLMSGASIIIQIVAILTILYVGKVILVGYTFKPAKGICIFFAVYLLLNSVMNFISHSKKEKYVMTPLALIASICFFITAFMN